MKPTPTPQLSDLITLMARLRSDCPWDAKQTNDSLLKYAIEETFELVQAVKADDNSTQATDDIKGELGDVLLQVVFHAHLYAEQGRFDMGDVIYTLQEKLIRRHPHVFDKETLKTDEDVKRRWDEIKAIENQGKRERLFDSVKAGTALTVAHDLQKKASTVGFDWESLQGTLDKLQEELGEFDELLPSGDFNRQRGQLSDSQKAKLQDELGDCLFALVNVARHLGLDSEQALHSTNAKFQRRFAFVEDSLATMGKTFADSDLAQMDGLWEQAKALEKGNYES